MGDYSARMGCGRSKQEAPRVRVDLQLKMEDKPTPEPQSSGTDAQAMESALLKACRDNELSQVEDILQQGKLDLRTVQFKYLHEHCQNNSSKNTLLLDVLLKHGADVDAVDEESGEAALHITCQDGDLEATRLLLSAGCNVNAKRNPGSAAAHQGPEEFYADGSTALHLAAEEGYADIVKVLTDAGADVHILDNRGWTPLHRAAAAEHADFSLEISKQLIAALEINQSVLSVNDYVNMGDQDGLTSVHSAVQHGTEAHRRLVEYLLSECAASPDTHDKEGQTPLHDAIEGSDTAMIGVLLRYNADHNQVNKEGETCSMLASRKGLDLAHC